MNSLFKNKTALILGGTSGMGYATAKQLLQQGAKWAAIIGSQQSKLEKAGAELAKFGEVKTFKADLSKWGEVEATIDFIRSLGQTDLLVNAVGVFAPKPFVEHTTEDYNKYLDLNKATFFITQQVVKT